MLIEKLPELKGLCNDTPYLASTADGKAYYEALFHLTTGTDMSVEECTELLQAKISEVYDTYMPLWQKNGTYFGYGDLSFDDARKWCERFTFEHFPQISANEVSIFNVPEKFSESVQPATYYSAPIDNFTKHTVWVNTGLVENPEYNMFTLISHEMYPGHLYQHQYQAENLESRYQVFATSKAYAEGWAKYSEWTMIHYAPFDPQLAESAWTASLLYSILIAARMSIGIEYEGWTYEDCETYLNHYGVDSSVMDEDGALVPIGIGTAGALGGDADGEFGRSVERLDNRLRQVAVLAAVDGDAAQPLEQIAHGEEEPGVLHQETSLHAHRVDGQFAEDEIPVAGVRRDDDDALVGHRQVNLEGPTRLFQYPT